MLVTLAVNVEQVRWYAQAALNSFETLDLETAAEVAQSELRALIRYLDAIDNTENTVAVNVCGGVKPLIVFENLVSDGESSD
jgi:6-phosphogluconolactonase/glucosamine-6-phosphate isomerase/deaminase